MRIYIYIYIYTYNNSDCALTGMAMSPSIRLVFAPDKQVKSDILVM